ncbi:MAG: hypothetical protein IIW54_01435 [Lachnospiraceae bacterium]|nr:hypothetical protein [Lachnospiraceae bacterium]
MVRRLRKKRVAGAIILLILLIIVPIFVLRSCSKKGSSQGDMEKGSVNHGTGGTVQSTTSVSAIAWPNELSAYVQEYKGAGNMVSVNSIKDEDGKTVYKVEYVGTSIDSCFVYTKDTLGLSGDWTEEVTGELYTFTRETNRYVLELRSEPKATNGYDFMIKVKIK